MRNRLNTEISNRISRKKVTLTLLPTAQKTPHFIAHKLQENSTAHCFVSFITQSQNVRTE